jgi:hypothetical protein
MSSVVDRTCERLAREQFGVLSRSQALLLGISDSGIGRRLASGQWERVHRGVYRIGVVPPSWHQRLMAACLWGGKGTVVSHRAAGALWNLDGVGPGFVEVTTRRQLARQQPRVLTHSSDFLSPMDRTMVGPLPVTTVTRTLIDLATVMSAKALEHALDSALRDGLTSVAEISGRVAELGGKGRAGVGVLRGMLEGYGAGAPVPESVLERNLLRLLEKAHLPPPHRQFLVTDGERAVARLDFAYPDLAVGIETDGYRWHGGRIGFERDRARVGELASLGWRVIQVTWKELDERPQNVVRRIRRALDPVLTELAPGKREPTQLAAESVRRRPIT